MNSKTSTTEAVSRWSIWRDWVSANILGEAIGLSIPAGIAALVVQSWDSASRLSLAVESSVLIVAGVAEGAVVGMAQALVLRRLFVRLRLKAWVMGTAFGAGVAWAMGLVPSVLLSSGNRTISEIGELNPLLQYTAAVVMGGVLGAVLGISQWWVLRRHVKKAMWWIPANAAAWVVGMPIVFLAAGSGDLIMTGWQTVALAGAILAIAGAVVGAVHGAALIWLVQQNTEPDVLLPRPTGSRIGASESERFRCLPLRSHSLLGGVPLHSLDKLELPGGEPGMTLQAISGVIGFDGSATMELGRATEMLFALRGAIGRLLDWDTPKPVFDAESYVHRLTAEDRCRSIIAPGTASGISKILYEFENELLGEIINRTVHCFWQLALEKTKGKYVLWFAVYVRKRNWFTPIYMAAISPLLRSVIYPAMLRGAKKRWLQWSNQLRVAAVC